MNLKSVRMHNVLNYENTNVDFPSTGVVVVTGPNGAGKSAIIEAAAVCFWGKTLRGTDPWASENGYVEVEQVDGLHVRRERRKGKVSLTFSVLDDTGARVGVDFETAGKAQEALERIVGPFDVWRRSAVFSSQDAAHFTLATDAERKRLLEAILGIDRFDEALDDCRADLRGLQGKAERAEQELRIANERLVSEQRRQDEAKAFFKDAGGEASDMQKLVDEAKRLDALHRSSVRAVREVATSIAKARETGAANRSTLSALARVLERIKSDLCPTCNQKITPKMRDDVQKRMQSEQISLDTLEKASSVTIGDLSAQLEELEEEMAGLEARARSAFVVAEAASGASKNRVRFEAILKESTKAIAELNTSRDAHRTRIADVTSELAVVKACERVLGTKGARAHVLGKALGGLEGVANAWLSRIADPGTTLKVSAYTEKKSGGVSDSISIEVTGYGGGFGYRASSGGQRRRIDVALLLALGEVAGAAHGTIAGTLFADEVFDTLDGAGVERVSAALHELAEHRAVIVIAHNATLVAALGADFHWRVEAGRLAA